MEKMMKKISILTLVLILSLTVFAGCGGDAPADGGSDGTGGQIVTDTGSGADEETDATAEIGEIELRLAYPNTEMSVTGRAFTRFSEKVSELSGGKMTVVLYPAGSLIQNADVVDALQNNTVDFSHFNISFVTPVVKEFTPLEVPGLLPADKFKEMDAATHDLLAEIFERYNIHYVAPIDSGTGVFSTVKSMIKTPADLTGKSVRAAGKWVGNAVTGWGGAPVTVALGDIPTSLERGVVDSAYAGWIVAGPNKFYEQAPFVTFTDMAESFTGFAMSKASWDNLSPAQQAVIDAAAEDFIDYVNQLSMEEVVKIKADITAAGAEYYDLTPAENEAFKAVLPGIIDEAIAAGGDDAAKLVDAFNSVK